MKHLISWYIVPYLTAIIIALVAWIVAIYATDGIVPVVCGLIMLGIVVFTIPVMIYMDYRTVKEMVLRGVTAYQEPERRTEFFQQVAVTISSQMGMPEFLAEYAVSRVIKKFNL
jgi:hypothetical protein